MLLNRTTSACSSHTSEQSQKRHVDEQTFNAILSEESVQWMGKNQSNSLWSVCNHRKRDVFSREVQLIHQAVAAWDITAVKFFLNCRENYNTSIKPRTHMTLNIQVMKIKYTYLSQKMYAFEKTQEKSLRKQESICKMEARKRKTNTWRRRTAESESRPRALAVCWHADTKK